MDISSELNRWLPGEFEGPTDAKAQDFIRFVRSLSKANYEAVLKTLPDRLERRLRATVVRETSAWGRFIDTVAYQCVYGYSHHVAPPVLSDHVLVNSGKPISSTLRRLAVMLSPPVRKRLLEELLALEVGHVLTYLESQFKGDRPGLIDVALEESLKVLEKRKPPPPDDPTYRVARDELIIRTIQAQRRANLKRLPETLNTVAEVRFVVEEIKRELFVYYPAPDLVRALNLIGRTWKWFESSELKRRHHVVHMNEANFFSDLLEISDKIRIAVGNDLTVAETIKYVKPHWDAMIQLPLKADRFWHNVAGLNRDKGVPYESTEAASREAAYRQWASVEFAAGTVFIIIMLGIAAPGVAAGLLRWVGGRLLLSARYFHATYKAYGVIGGTGAVARDAYVTYLQNAPSINEKITIGAEIALNFVGEETGLAPNSSPADLLSAAASYKLAAVTDKKGLSRLATEALQSQAREAEVKFVQFMGQTPDGKVHNVVGRITGYENGKLKVIAESVSDATADADIKARKKLIFYSEPRADSPVLADARGTLSTETKSSAVADVPPKVSDKSASADKKALSKHEAEEAKAAQVVPVSSKTSKPSLDTRKVEPQRDPKKRKQPTKEVDDPEAAKPPFKATDRQDLAGDSKVADKATADTAVSDASRATGRGNTSRTAGQGLARAPMGKLPPPKARKTPRFYDPHNMRPDPTNFDRQTAGAGGIDSISFLKDPDGRYAVKITGTLEEGLYRGSGPAPPGKIKAPNYNGRRKFVSNKEAGLNDGWENAHLWGPGFGDEAAAGMMKAPKEVNQWYQNEGIEGWMRDLRKQAVQEGGALARVEVEATAIAWDLTGHQWQPKTQVDFLKRAEYRVRLHLPNKPPQPIRVTIEVAAPPSRKKPVVEIDPPYAANLADLFSILRREPGGGL